MKSIREQHLPLEQYLRKDIAAYDPAHPDSVAAFHLPASPEVSMEKPAGN